MLIKFYGTRGSIPVCSDSTIKYGGNTTCLYIETDAQDSIIIDAGSGIRELGIDLIKKLRNNLHLIFTHYHWDHILGFPYFAPAYSKETHIDIYGPENEVNAKKALSYQMRIPFFPTIKLTDLPAKIRFNKTKRKFKIGSIMIEIIQNNHPNYTYGLKFTENNKTVVFLTDNELKSPKPNTPYNRFVSFVGNADLLIHDAQYGDEDYPTKIGWGHSTFTQAMELAKESGVRHIILTHHDPSSSDDFINKVLKDLQKKYPDYEVDAAKSGTEIIL